MSAGDSDNPVLYEQLEDLQDEFEQVDVELLRMQHKLTRDLYVKRDKIISKIPNFWPLVFEQAPPEIDEYMQLEDAAVISSALKNLHVERFELPDGNPRSFSIKFEFTDNDWFHNKTLEKKFWWRLRKKDDFSGLVSEPVEIDWKPGKDLTNGLLTLAKKIHEDDKAGKSGDTENKRQLCKIKAVASTESRSFFNFFGFRGHYITEEESLEATKAVEEERKARKEGKEIEVKEGENADADEDVDVGGDDEEHDAQDEYESEYKYDVFPPGAEIALAIAEDLWPEAIQLFQESEELAAINEMDVGDDEDDEDDKDDQMAEDEDEDEGENESEGKDGGQPSKKRKV
ncbi:NAP family protein [Metarhizium album ARSEF 1941]|uniref:NAP family protein n=1 Tax=Metarhizium album (strain ARSEF 1941) TaxID=1081103 RepID=A0A0B2WM94_METAS|nr:NAP family protein [Metarhizium album ARSEF 1941]KHN94617.1 NAP family protein [Metarhizium album ARSEF 1941]